MFAVYKYPLEITDEQIVKMPHGAELLCVQEQKGVVCLWAKVCVGVDSGKRLIQIRGTGHKWEAGGTGKYVGTVQTNGGRLVWHVFDGFEVIEK